jgi:A/G-specific adenine glycosylase
LLRWFRRHARPLPWRANRDPYSIWVSEIMLQQTQVATVIPFFRRFLESFPTIETLARASQEDVLRHWEGLGYYRRARDLHRAAQILTAEHRGRLPDDPGLLGRLPGFGRYTVGAVLSQAYDRPLPILEANSRRVLCRLFALRTDPRRGPGLKRLWKLAQALLPSHNAGEFNQALMELGALRCSPRSPECPACPLKEHCQARQRGLQEAIPVRARLRRHEDVEEVGVVVRRGRRVLVVQRPPNGRWASLWEFPHAPLRDGETHRQAAVRLLNESTGIAVYPGKEIVTLRHGITRYRITLVCLAAARRRGRFHSGVYSQGRWVEPAELLRYPVSAPQRRLVRAVITAFGPGTPLGREPH